MIIKRLFGVGVGNIFQVFVDGISFIITMPKGSTPEQIQTAAQTKYNSMNQDQEEFDV
jgi:hypothetical protein